MEEVSEQFLINAHQTQKRMVLYAIHFVILVMLESLLYVGRFAQVDIEMMELSALNLTSLPLVLLAF
jgi:hypothetical protein